MNTLYLLRHGPTEAGRLGAPLGQLDWPVNPAGLALWPGVKADLLTLGLQRVLSSELGRARVHAQDLGLPCQLLPGLGEQDFGAWDGRPWGQIDDSEGFFADPVHQAPPAGESFAQCAHRTLAQLPVLLAGPFPVLVLAHAGPLRALLAHFLGLPLERALDLAWQPYGLTRLELYDEQRGALAFHNQALPGQGPCP